MERKALEQILSPSISASIQCFSYNSEAANDMAYFLIIPIEQGGRHNQTRYG